MSTSYYAVSKTCCLQCGHALPGEEKVKIGQSAAGWAFALCSYPREVSTLPKTLRDWATYLKTPGRTIRDEYCKELSYDDLMRQVLCRHGMLDTLPHSPAWLRENNAYATELNLAVPDEARFCLQSFSSYYLAPARVGED